MFFFVLLIFPSFSISQHAKLGLLCIADVTELDVDSFLSLPVFDFVRLIFDTFMFAKFSFPV